MSGLHALRELEVLENALPEIPDALRGRPLPRRLDLRGNKLHDVPHWLADLPALEKLDLRWNSVDHDAAPLRALRERGCVVLA
ncbi:Leucine-rich repeat domain-containing protein OS=Streptomyces rimosus subsp. rimosus (strain ATCC / DSM 40260 / JCM 4667 / NRRL 2234) OX=1265868 GN=SRIM_005570 PE=4 SV=1 [Streptomyces rimosus subsp. rimosus]